MAAEQNGNGSAGPVKSVVVVTCPSGRELLWVAAHSPIASWQVGDDVTFRNHRWRVTGRTHDGDALSFTLGALR